MKLTPLTKAIRASIGASLLLSAAMPLMAQDTNEEIEVEEECWNRYKIVRRVNRSEMVGKTGVCKDLESERGGAGLEPKMA